MEDEKYVDDFLCTNALNNGRPIVILNPGAAWRTKEWGVEKYGLLGKRIQEENLCNILISWGPGEENMAKEVASIAGRCAIVAPPTSLKESLALLKRGELFIGADSGPLHMAAALGINTVAILGPSDPVRNGPYGVGHEIVQKNLSCSNCYKRECVSTECMKSVTPDEVYEKVKKKIDSFNDS